jgi:hypothetical protein
MKDLRPRWQQAKAQGWDGGHGWDGAKSQPLHCIYYVSVTCIHSCVAETIPPIPTIPPFSGLRTARCTTLQAENGALAVAEDAPVPASIYPSNQMGVQ